MIGKDELRPCVVEIMMYPQERLKKPNFVKTKPETHKGYFHTWAIEQYTVNDYVKSVTPGQISCFYGIVEYEDGSIHKVDPELITFTDRKEKNDIMDAVKELHPDWD